MNQIETASYDPYFLLSTFSSSSVCKFAYTISWTMFMSTMMLNPLLECLSIFKQSDYKAKSHRTDSNLQNYDFYKVRTYKSPKALQFLQMKHTKMLFLDVKMITFKTYFSI